MNLLNLLVGWGEERTPASCGIDKLELLFLWLLLAPAAHAAGNPNGAATPRIKPEIADNPAIFLTARDVARLEILRDFDAKNRRILSRMWTEIKVR